MITSAFFAAYIISSYGQISPAKPASSCGRTGSASTRSDFERTDVEGTVFTPPVSPVTNIRLAIKYGQMIGCSRSILRICWTTKGSFDGIRAPRSARSRMSAEEKVLTPSQRRYTSPSPPRGHMLFFPTRYAIFNFGCFFLTSASSRINVVSWLIVRTAITIFRFLRSARRDATTLDFPLPVGASIMPISPSRATSAANASISRWWGRYSAYGKKGSKLSIAGIRLALWGFMSVA